MACGCYECGWTSNLSGFKATTEALEFHLATSKHYVKDAMGKIALDRPRERCQHGWYTYGGPLGDRTRIEVGPHLLYGQEIAESSAWERFREGVKEMTGGFYLGVNPPGPFGSSAGRAPAVSQTDMVKQDHQFKVLDVFHETPNTVTIITDYPPEWQPGQFSMLGVPGHGEVPISFSGVVGDDGGTPAFTQQTIRAVGRVTGEIVKLRPGDTVTQRGPFGRGWQNVYAEDMLIIAGGCGIAPLKPVIEQRWTPGGSRNEYTTIIYGARDRDDFYFRDEEWFEGSFRITNADGFACDRIQPWMVEPETVALVCGPPKMMEACALKCIDLGMKAENIQVSLERNMTCGLGMCGQCNIGDGRMCCKDGPVFSWAELGGKL